ncbi:MAG: hypothetical protein ACXWI6_03460 [Burkholderiales bacterium]
MIRHSKTIRTRDSGAGSFPDIRAQFAAHIKSELARWAKVVRDNRIEPQ